MKRTFYIFCAMVLGFLLQLIIHASIESWYIGLLLSHFDMYGLGLSWEMWFVIHSVFTAVLGVSGIFLGYYAGIRWWHIVYVERRHWMMRRRTQ